MKLHIRVGQKVRDLETNEIGTITDVGTDVNRGDHQLNEDQFEVNFHYPAPDEYARIVFARSEIGIEVELSND